MTKEEKKTYMKEWHAANKEKEHKYRQSKKEQISDNGKKWRDDNKEHVKIKRKESYQSNKEQENELGKKYRKNNSESLKEYRASIKEKTAEYDKSYRKLNKDKIALYKKEYNRERIKNDPVYKMSKKIRNLIGLAFKNKGFTKKTKTYIILGCSFEEYKAHIESKFEPWMNWTNYGPYILDGERTWNIDHIIPIASASTEDEVIKLNHYANLRPLCSKENLDKWYKII